MYTLFGSGLIKRFFLIHVVVVQQAKHQAGATCTFRATTLCMFKIQMSFPTFLG